MLMFITVTSLLFHCSETFSCHGERPLLCDIFLGDINVEMLSWYDNVCLVRIDRYDNTMNNVHIGTFAQAYTLDIANDSLNCDDLRAMRE